MVFALRSLLLGPLGLIMWPVTAVFGFSAFKHRRKNLKGEPEPPPPYERYTA